MKKSIFLTAAFAAALLLIPGCASRTVGSTAVAATEAAAPTETVDLESDLVSKFEAEDFETGERQAVCTFDLVQNETAVTIYKLAWDTGAKLRIGIRSEDGAESNIDTARGELTNVIPDFGALPSGKYTLFLENIGDGKISSVHLYYGIG